MYMLHADYVFVLCLIPRRFPAETVLVFLNILFALFLICISCPAISEGVLWQEANALQFPELLATATCPHSQGHLQEGNYFLTIMLFYA